MKDLKLHLSSTCFRFSDLARRFIHPSLSNRTFSYSTGKPAGTHQRLRKTSASLPKEQEALSSSSSSRNLSRRHDVAFDIQKYCRKGQISSALDALSVLLSKGSSVPENVYWSILKSCSEQKSLAEAKKVHAFLAKHNKGTSSSLLDYLVSTLAKCGGIEDALHLFNQLGTDRTVLSWTAVITAFTEAGKGHEAIKTYLSMQNEGFQPNAYTIVSLLKACGDILDIKNGMELHSQASMKGLDEHDFVASALLTMYGKCGNLEEAEQVFNRLPKHNIVLWNAMLCAYGDRVEGEKIWLLYERMEAEGIEPNERTFVSLIQACCMLAEREEGAMVQGKLLKEKSLAAGRQLHACVSTKGLMTNVIICNILISMFGKCGSIADAESIFWKMSNHTVVSWTAMVTAYIEQDYPEIALQIFAHLQRGNVSPNEWTYTNAIQACCCLVEEEELFSVKCWRTRELPLVIARSLHADARKRGYDVDLSVGSMLINLYGKCGSCHEGVHLFNTLPKRSVGLWNVLLSAYIEQGAGDTVLHLYRLMQEEGVLPDEQTSVIALQACSLLAIEEEPAYMLGRKIKKVSLDIGRAIHTDAQMMGFDRDVFFGSMLVSMYGKCGSVVDAENVFEGLVNCDVVAWTAMLSCYGEQGLAQSASDLYQKMQVKGVIIDSGALISLLQACRDTGTFELCKQVHFDIVAAEEDDLLLTTALVHAYSYCSSMVDARAVFNTLLEPDLVSWNSLITGHTKLGSYALSFETFDCMKREGIKPNEVTFLTLLSTCGHAGLVSKGIELFESMSKEYGLIPKIDHFGTLVDLLGRTGNLKTAEDMLLRLPGEPDLAMWLCLLDACQKHGNLILGEHVFNQAVLLYPDSASAYVMMSNMYANEGLWESARLVDQIGHKRCILN